MIVLFVSLTMNHAIGGYQIWMVLTQRINSARRLIGSRITKSTAYCNQILLVQLFINSTQNSLVN
jgi:hypothetical protein